MALKNEFGQNAGDGSTLIQSAGTLNYTPTSTTNNYYPQNTLTSNHYVKLVEEYKNECQTPDSILYTIIAKVQHYVGSADSEFVGLEKKLRDGGFENDIQWATLLKERYTKYLTQNNLSKATQKIHAFLLAKIWVAFNLYIPDAIKENKTNSEIKDILIEKIIKPTEDELGIDNVLELYRDDVLSMVYFLTGNCHLKWDTDVNLPPSV